MRKNLPGLRLAIVAAAAIALGCWPTGPDTNPGLTTCEQLRECACDPERTTDVAGCNQTVDTLEGSTNPDSSCRAALTSFGCGTPLQVNGSPF